MMGMHTRLLDALARLNYLTDYHNDRQFRAGHVTHIKEHAILIQIVNEHW